MKENTLIANFNDAERLDITTVKNIAQSKLRELLSDLPVDTYPYFKESILTGGCFASLLLGEEVHDWDVYLKDFITSQALERFVMSDTPTLNEVAGVTPGYMTEVKVRGKLVTPNATTFKNGLQVITMTGKEHRETFDFVHCMPYFDMATQQLFISRQQYDAIKTKTLIKNPNHLKNLNPQRVDKFMERGWRFAK
jgi:hypothetical protein